MPRLINTIALLLIIAFCGASQAAATYPAAEAGVAVQGYLRKVGEVTDIAWPLLVAGADMCEVDTAYRTGMKHSYRSGDTSGGEGAFVAAVAKGSPAADAGLLRGDRIIAINGDHVESLIPGRGSDRLEKLIEGAAKRQDRVVVSVERDGQVIDLGISPVKVCDLKVEYVPGDHVRSPRAGEHVIVSDMLFSVGQSRWQQQAFLAADMAYAMSATAKRNATVKKLTGFASGFLGAVTGVDSLDTVVNMGTSVALSKTQSLKADRAALFLLARAGIDVKQVPGFWESVYAYPQSSTWAQTYFGSRPALSERQVVFATTLNEIASIQQSGGKMLPTKS